MSLSCKAAFVTLADASSTDQLVAFYQKLLNQKPIIYSPGRYAEFHLPGLRLGIFHPRADHQPEFAAPSSGGMSLCLEVEKLETAIAHLTQIGYPPSGEIIYASHGRELYATDPAGNRLILHETLESC